MFNDEISQPAWPRVSRSYKKDKKALVILNEVKNLNEETRLFAPLRVT